MERRQIRSESNSPIRLRKRYTINEKICRIKYINVRRRSPRHLPNVEWPRTIMEFFDQQNRQSHSIWSYPKRPIWQIVRWPMNALQDSIYPRPTVMFHHFPAPTNLNSSIPMHSRIECWLNSLIFFVGFWTKKDFWSIGGLFRAQMLNWKKKRCSPIIVAKYWFVTLDDHLTFETVIFTARVVLICWVFEVYFI